jgi:hypothetical protein
MLTDEKILARGLELAESSMNGQALVNTSHLFKKL